MKYLIDTAGVIDLPRHHGDPFDRLMAVQALRRNLRIIISDAIFDPYGLKRIWSGVRRSGY